MSIEQKILRPGRVGVQKFAKLFRKEDKNNLYGLSDEFIADALVSGFEPQDLGSLVCRRYCNAACCRNPEFHGQTEQALTATLDCLAPGSTPRIPVSYDQDFSGSTLRSVAIYKDPRGGFSIRVIGGCVNLRSDGRCGVFDSPSRPIACGENFPVGGSECNLARKIEGLTPISELKFHQPLVKAS